MTAYLGQGATVEFGGVAIAQLLSIDGPNIERTMVDTTNLGTTTLRTTRPQEKDWRTNEKSKAAAVFKEVRDLAAYDETYQQMRREWRANESTYATRVDALATTSNVTRSRYSPKRTNVSR